MQIVIDIPDEQIEKSLMESRYIHENEGEKGSVHIAMLYTNAQLEFVDVERKTDFYSCEYKILPKEPKTGHWIADVDKWGDIVTTVNGYRCDKCNTFNSDKDNYCPNCGAKMLKSFSKLFIEKINTTKTIIEADKGESEDKE